MGTDHKKTYRGAGGAKYKKNIRARENHIKKKINARHINPEKYSSDELLPSAFKLASHEEELEFRSSPRNKRLRGRLPSNSLKIYSSTVKNADCD